MENTNDIEWLADLLEESPLLFYGDFEQPLNNFLKEVFQHELKDFGFGDVPMNDEFVVAYWFLISWMNSKKLVEYGTSPRGCWLTEDGKRLKKMVLENEDAISEATEFIYNKYH